MTEITKETITTTEADNTDSANTIVATPVNSEGTSSSNPIMAKQVQTAATNSQTSEYLIYYIFGALEILLSFRLILKLMGASVTSAFVRFIYGLTGLFILPFEGIFHREVAQGIETASVLEPANLVAIIVYAILAWGIVKLVVIFSGEKQQAA